MRIAGVRMADGRLVWVDAGDLDIEPLDDVDMVVDRDALSGTVTVAPQSLLRPVETVGQIVHTSSPGRGQSECSELPGADMPALGSGWGDGTVVAVDAVNRTATVEMADGSRADIDVPASSTY
jgi:hypothetical protein